MTTRRCRLCKERPAAWVYHAGPDAALLHICTPCLREGRDRPWPESMASGIVWRYPGKADEQFQLVREVNLDA